MTQKEYNEKLELVAEVRNLSLSGQMFKKYEDAFWDWYGDPSFEDIHCTFNFPENDFGEWFRSRIVIVGEPTEDNVEILPEDLEAEIQSAFVTNS